MPKNKNKNKHKPIIRIFNSFFPQRVPSRPRPQIITQDFDRVQPHEVDMILPMKALSAVEVCHDERTVLDSGEPLAAAAMVNQQSTSVSDYTETEVIALVKLHELYKDGLVTDQELSEHRLLCPITLSLISKPLAIGDCETIFRFEEQALEAHRDRCIFHPLLRDVVVTDDMVFSDFSFYTEVKDFVEKKEQELKTCRTASIKL